MNWSPPGAWMRILALHLERRSANWASRYGDGPSPRPIVHTPAAWRKIIPSDADRLPSFVAPARNPRAVAGLIGVHARGIRQGRRRARDPGGRRDQIAAHLPARPEPPLQPASRCLPPCRAARTRLKEEARRAIGAGCCPPTAGWRPSSRWPCRRLPWSPAPRACGRPRLLRHRVRRPTRHSRSRRKTSGPGRGGPHSRRMVDWAARWLPGPAGGLHGLPAPRPALHAPAPTSCCAGVAWIKRMDGQLPRLFGHAAAHHMGWWPGDDVAPGNTSARYWPRACDGRTAGFFTSTPGTCPAARSTDGPGARRARAPSATGLQRDGPAFRRFGDFGLHRG